MWSWNGLKPFKKEKYQSDVQWAHKHFMRTQFKCFWKILGVLTKDVRGMFNGHQKVYFYEVNLNNSFWLDLFLQKNILFWLASTILCFPKIRWNNGEQSDNHNSNSTTDYVAVFTNFVIKRNVPLKGLHMNAPCLIIRYQYFNIIVQVCASHEIKMFITSIIMSHCILRLQSLSFSYSWAS